MMKYRRIALTSKRFYRAVSQVDRESFLKNGYVVMKGTLDSEEVEIVKETMERSHFLSEYEMKVDSDVPGQPGKQTIFNHPGNGTLGDLTRSERIAGVSNFLLGSVGVHHYFNKMLRKEPRDLGNWKWHQDYGSYWYFDHFLRPDMLTVWVAVDGSYRENGCLKVIRGSHQFGRIDCKVIGNQRVIDPARLEAILQRAPVDYVEMNPGDTVFFHGNTLHSSEGNPSDKRRMAFAAHFTRADNLMFIDPTSTGLNLFTSEIDIVSHNRLKENGVVLDEPEDLGLQDPGLGAIITSKRSITNEM